MSSSKAIALTITLCCGLLAAGNIVYAQPDEDVDHSLMQRWGVTLDWIELELDNHEESATDFERYEARLGSLIEDIEQFKAQATKALETPKLELEALGAEPQEG